MITRTVQMFGLELILGLACVVAGLGSMVPSRGLVYTLLSEYPYARGLSFGMLFVGICLCWAAVRGSRRLRIRAAYCANGGWAAIGVAYVQAGQFGLVLFFSALFFAFNCFIAHERWD